MRYKEKRPQIGDLVCMITDNHKSLDPPYQVRIGIVVGHLGIRSEVEWNDGTYSEPMRAALEVL